MIQTLSRLMPPCGLLVLLLAILLPAGAQNRRPLIREGSDNVSNFDAGWLFIRYGLQADGSRREEPAGLENNLLPESGWEKLDLPHDWAISGPFRVELTGETGKLPFKGIGWYRKHFILPAADRGKKIFLDFDGAMAYSKVWLNGQYVGGWPYGYSSFRLDLSPFVQAGAENIVDVRLDTESWDSRWYPGAGIYRHVWLVKTDPLHVSHWGSTLTCPQVNRQAATVAVKISVDNSYADPVKASLQTEIYELGPDGIPGKLAGRTRPQPVDLKGGETRAFSAGLMILRPRLWELDHPQRYLASSTLTLKGRVLETYHTIFGIRSLQFSAHQGFLLNGKRVAIQGTCNHHDLGALGAAFNESALKRQLKLLKEMGCNALRTSHNPPAPELLELADKMGFLVWDEAFDAWRSGKKEKDYNKIFAAWHRQDLEAMVNRDRNHPAVIIWSIGNEVLEQQDTALTRELAGIVQQADPTRPVSNGYNDPDGGRASGAAAALDIMGVNYFFSQQPKWDADPRYRDKPTLGSETSSCISSRGEYFLGSRLQHWQVASFDSASPDWGCMPDEQFRTLARYPQLLGEFVWTGFDYLGEPTPYNSDESNLLNLRNDPARREELEKKLAEIRAATPPSRSSYFGILDLAGFKKDRFYLYQSHWRPALPMAHLLPHWNWDPGADSLIPVQVYTSGDGAELFLNGKSLGRKTRVRGKDFRLVWPAVRYEPGTLKVIAFKNGKRWAADSVSTAGPATRLAATPDVEGIKNDGQELCFITVRVLDRAGRQVPGSHPEISFSLQGPGEILATDNGDPTCFIPFQSRTRPAFNGMALVIIKARPGGKGKLILKASAQGLQPSEISLPLKAVPAKIEL